MALTDSPLFAHVSGFISSFETVFSGDWPHSKEYIAEIPENENFLSTPGKGKWSCHIALIEAYIAVKKEMARLKMLEAENDQRSVDKIEKAFLDRVSR